jgi:hypothetical protein
MSDETTVLFGFAVLFFFIWRFARTHQLYRFSRKVLRGYEEPVQIKPSISREFLNHALLGNRNVEPSSFYIRAIVFITIALVLLPFKDYARDLYWIITVLIILYVPWCMVHGLLLKKKKQVMTPNFVNILG